MKDIKDSAKLHNGVEMPWLGFGTFKIPEGSEVIDSVTEALNVGYRHIDTAAAYGNEEGVGKALLESSIPRREIFLTSKVWNSDQGYDTTLKAFDASLGRLGTDYLDLYLIHWPKAPSKETWRALERLYKEKRVRAIGVSNFKIHHLKEIFENCEVKPMVNQVELHPQFPQTELHHFCKEHGIILEAWAPLMQGRIFDIPLMKELASKYHKTISQIALRWDLQMGIITIPKSTHPERIAENAEIFDFVISKEDMERIRDLDTGSRIGPDPDHITF